MSDKRGTEDGHRGIGEMSMKALTKQVMAQCSLDEEHTWNIADVEVSASMNGHHKAGT